MATYDKLKRLNRARDYIADNYLSPFDLTAISQQANMSIYHFLRVFRDVYGETPNEFMIRMRIEKAKKMLVTENYSISNVCERVGYSSLGSFSSLFCKHVGVAPSGYRRMLWSLSNEAFCFPVRTIPACYAYHFLGN